MNGTGLLVSKLPKRHFLALGLSLRLLLAPFLSHPFDMRVFMAVGAAVASGATPYGQYNLQEIFAETPHPHLHGTFPGIGYPPPWGIINGLAYSLSAALAPNNLYAYVLALKIPVILAELGIAVLVYNILKSQTDEKTASKAFLLFLFCPFIIAVGTAWGMYDLLACLFALLSAYTLVRHWKLSSIFLAAASVLKLFPIILAPLYSLLLYKSNRNRKVVAGFMLYTVALTGLLTIMPMIMFRWPISNMFNALFFHVSPSNPYTAYSQVEFPYGAASIFNAVTFLDNVSDVAIQPPWIFIYLWIPACLLVYMLLLRADIQNVDFTSNIQWSLLLILTLFTTRLWVSEQNVTFLFAFLALSVFLQNPHEVQTVRLLWVLLFSFVMVHVPAPAFFWLPYPWTLDAACSFADGPLGWTRLLLMTLLTFSWVSLSWHYVAKKLRWWS